jgi:diguanylate cyclase (GGDEF)-like protein
MTTRYCSAAVIGNNWAIDIINEGMSKIKENKTYDKIYYKWFGEEVGGKYKKHLGMLKVLAAALTVSLLCFFTAFYINRRLKKAVYTRTMELAAANVELNYQNDELSKYNIELEILNSRLNNEIKERKRAEEIIWYQAHYDFLTDLPNRKLFIDKLEEALKEVENRDERLAVLFLDLDNYKYINDTSGHEVGDKLLQEMAKRLRNMAGENEVISRFGGDEFTILIKSFKDIKYVTDFAEKMFDMMKEPFVIENWQIKQTASLGISIYPDSGRDAQTLLRRADALMYSAKEKGGNDYKIHKKNKKVTS